MPEVRIEPPALGLSDDWSYTDQPPKTTRDAKNVRLIDPGTGRTRLSQRSGLTKFNDTQISGSNKVQHMASIVDAGASVVFTSAVDGGDITLEWSGGLTGGACRDITTDKAGLVYAIDGLSNVKVLNREGTVLGDISVGLDTGGTTMLGRVLVDEVTGNVFVVDVLRAVWETPFDDGLTLNTSSEIIASGGATRIRMFARVGAEYVYELAWESDFDANVHYMDMDLRGGSLYAVATNSSGDSSVGGNYVFKYLLGGFVPVLATVSRIIAIGDNLAGHWMRMAATEGGEVFVAVNDDGLNLQTGAHDATMTALYRLDSSLTTIDGWPESGVSGGGFGSALHYNEKSQRLYSLGYATDSGGPLHGVLKAIDVSEEAYTEDWSVDLTGWKPLDPYMVMDTDQLGNLVVPDGVSGFGLVAARVFAPDDGTTVISYTPFEHSDEGTSQPYYSVATDKVGLPFGGGRSNLVDFAGSFDLTDAGWSTSGTLTVTADADEGPFFDGMADHVSEQTSGDVSYLEYETGVTTITNPLVSAYIKPDPSDTPSTTDLELLLTNITGSVLFGVTIDWSTSPPTVSEAGSPSAVDGFGIIGPVNGYYRFYARFSSGDLTQLTAVAPRITPASDGNSDMGSVFVYGVKVERSDTGEPSDLNQLHGTELVFLGSQGEVFVSVDDEAPFTTARAIRLVTGNVNNDQTRRRVNVAVADGDLKVFTDTAILGIAGGQNSTDPLEGLSPDSPYIDSTVAFGNLILVDGARSLVYDIADGSLEPYKATSAGSIPKYPGLCTTWGGRVVLASFAGNKDDWAMSAIADPFDWDFGTVVNVPTAAVNGSSAPYAGRVPDIVTALIPISDDLMLFGGDQSIHRLTGNPKVDGQIDLISDITGIAFGKAWAKDPEGNLYFMGSKGRLYFAAGGVGTPQPVTERSIDRRLEAVDLGTYRYHLEWNYRERGLHIFQIPYGSGGTAVDHWFFERKNGGIWEDRTGSTSAQPTSAMVLDGDTSSDRVVLLGCEDGYIRKWDEDANDDDGSAIDSYCLMGPYHLNNDREVKLTAVRGVTAPDESAVHLEVFAEDEPQELGTPVYSKALQPGRNENFRLRARGSYGYFRLRNAAASQTWSLESLYATLSTGGRRRIRA